MKRRASLSAEAALDIDDIYEYTQDHFGTQQADRYVSGLFAEIDDRCNNPSHASRTETQLASRIQLSELRSFLYKGFHRCYFTFDDERLFVLAVYHGARNPQLLLEKMRRSLDEME